MEIIQTARLVLRDFEEADWEAVHSYGSDLEVVRYMDWGPNTEEETKKFIQRAIAHQKEQPRRIYTLAIVLSRKISLLEVVEFMFQTQIIERDGLATA